MSDSNPPVSEKILLEDFLETTPPNVQCVVKEEKVRSFPNYRDISPEPLRIYCESPECDREMTFDHIETSGHVYFDHWCPIFIRFQCRHCGKRIKIFALFVNAKRDVSDLNILKIGELPTFGPPTPRKLLTLIKSDFDFFSKGRRAESQGLGIAAFAYYRRVVENQKGRLIGEILKVAEELKTSPDMIKILKQAKDETQFSRAIEMIKEGIPEVIKISGHNPLTLLHDALSQGLHSDSDEECLQLATTIRTILIELSEKLTSALAQSEELKQSLALLLEKRKNRQ